MSRARGWCFTVNNPDTKPTVEMWGVPKYLVIGMEVGESGTPHWQGYVEYDQPKTLAGMKKIHATAHFEKRMGTPKQAADYCKKDGEYIEHGELPAQGKRTDLEEACTDILSGEFKPEDHPAVYVKFHKGIQALISSQIKPRTEKPKVVWLWGETGVGKTREAYGNGESVYFKDNTRWWDGYTGQKTIIIDDIDPKEWGLRDILRLLDRYPYQGQTKGGYVHINSPVIYITCDKGPERFWPGAYLDQVMRRIDECTEVKCTEVAGNTDRHP